MARALIIALVGTLLVASCRKPSAEASDPATPAAVWAAIQPHAARYRIEPAFIYALVAAESNFTPHARNGEARGLMQLKPGAWREVSRAPYEPDVWVWRKNLETGVDYLAWCRSFLHRKNKFSYPLLLAAFHYGVDYVEQREFDLGRIEPPENELYRAMWRGDLAPLPPPVPPKP